MGNAAKFTLKGYIKIKIILKNRHRNNSKMDLEFNVEDTGIGIKDKDMPKLF